MIQNMIKDGKIVPSKVTIKLLLQRAMQESSSDKFLIDGFPRNEENHSAFESVESWKLCAQFNHWRCADWNRARICTVFFIVQKKRWSGAFWARIRDEKMITLIQFGRGLRFTWNLVSRWSSITTLRGKLERLPRQYFLENVDALARGEASIPHARVVGQFSSAEARKVHEVVDPRSHG